jgi:CubicO group peptidase (beta-lactamase class C family)
LGFILLGAVIEAITGAPLSAYFEARIAQPLGLTRNDVRFGPVGDHDGHIVATAHDNSHEQRMIEDPARNAAFVSELANSQESRPLWRTQTFVGEVNDGNAHHVFGGTAAHAGLFATASAISALLASMTASGHRGHLGSKLFGQEVVHTFLRPAAGDDYLGWANPCTWQSLAPWHPTLAAHGCVITEGFTGCMGFGVPSLGLSMSMLANRQHQGTDDPAAMPKLYPYWAQIIEALVCALNP